jgi:hypothetical protein
MRDIVADVERWRGEGRSIALATVIQTWGSAPRPAGAKMAMTADGLIAGSVSGGCVENAVIEAGRETLKTGVPRLLHYGVSDDTAWNVGLACGGTIDVFVEPLAADLYEKARAAILAERPAAMATVIEGPSEQLGRKLLLLDEPLGDMSFVPLHLLSCAAKQSVTVALTSTVAFREELVLVTARHIKTLAELRAATPESGPTALVFRTGCTYRQRLEQVFTEFGWPSASRFELGTLDGMIGCVAADMGVTLLPRAVVGKNETVSIHKLSAVQSGVETLFIQRRSAHQFSALRGFAACLNKNGDVIAA